MAESTQGSRRDPSRQAEKFQCTWECEAMDTHEFYTDSVTKKNNKKSKVEKERGLSSLAAAAVDAAREGVVAFLGKTYDHENDGSDEMGLTPIIDPDL